MAQDLIPHADGALPMVGGTAPRASEICSRGLWKLLSEGDDWRGQVRLIALNPALRKEVAAVAPILATRSQPCSPEVLMQKLIEQTAAFGIPDRAPGLWAAMFKPYLEVMGRFSAEVIDEAFLRWHRAEPYPKDPGRCGFYPRPAELFALANPLLLEINAAAYRARRAIEYQERAPKPPPTKAEVAERRRQLIADGLMNEDGTFNLGPKPPPLPPLRPRETAHEVAERLRAAAASDDDDVEEAI